MRGRRVIGSMRERPLEGSGMVRVLRLTAPFVGAVLAITGLLLLALFVMRAVWPLLAIPVGLTLPHIQVGEAAPLMTVDEALRAPAGAARVSGDLYGVVGRPPRICEEVLDEPDGYRCVGGSLRVEGLANSPVPELELAEPAPWAEPGEVRTQPDVQLYGHVEDGVLTIPPPTA